VVKADIPHELFALLPAPSSLRQGRKSVSRDHMTPCPGLRETAAQAVRYRLSGNDGSLRMQNPLIPLRTTRQE
jgi:hypothetical protein